MVVWRQEVPISWPSLDPVVLHTEDVAGQLESSMGDDVLKFAQATPSKYPIIGDVIIKMDLQNSAQAPLLEVVKPVNAS